MNWRNNTPTEDLYNCLLVVKHNDSAKILMGNYWAAVGKFAVYSDLIDPSEVYYYATQDDILQDAGQFRMKDLQTRFNAAYKKAYYSDK